MDRFSEGRGGLAAAAALLVLVAPMVCSAGGLPGDAAAGPASALDQQSGQPSAPPASVTASAGVVVNGVTMTAEHLEAFRERYGALPAAGEWWYDMHSGLFGKLGGPAEGFMFAGHEFGPLDPDASRGQSGVFINGRQLPLTEVQTWAQLIGGPVMPGRYWFDAVGNVGYEGVPYPIGNLYLLVQSRVAQGGTGQTAGDHGWNTRFSSGNYTDDNSAGYVHVPGVGVIGSYGAD